MEKSVLFKERQQFGRAFLWLLSLFAMSIPLFGIIQQILFKKPFGNHPMSNIGLIVFAFGMLAFCIFFWSMTLITEIDSKAISVRFVPLFKKQFKWEDIERAEIIKYRFVGYGIRLSFKYGTVYNIKGNQGLALHLKDGGKYLIGTQKPEELKKSLASFL
ncbi:MAG: hypothetical protein E4H26_04900 [Flavobacteriales bacterium]|nr:MAG: hypothetical protein E4H26_04900 [Flavobacteriales bacterium]